MPERAAMPPEWDGLGRVCAPGGVPSRDVDPFTWDDGAESATRPRDWVIAALLVLLVLGALIAGAVSTVDWFVTNVYNTGE